MKLVLHNLDSLNGRKTAFLGNRKRKRRPSSAPLGDFALGRTYIHAPADLSLKNRELLLKTVAFAKSVQIEAESGRVFVDFSETVDISAAALVYLAGQFDLLTERFAKTHILFGKRAGSKKAQIILETSGFSDILSGRDAKGDFVLVFGEGSPGPYIDQIMEEIASIFGGRLEPEHEQIVYAAISEALLNVNYHAYEDGSDKKPWWLLTKVADGKLYLALYDVGVGIPVSLPRRHFFDRLRQVWNLNLNSDASLIAGAMEASRTSTGEEKHGKGSVDIKALVDKEDGCHLLIYSNRGLYQHKADGSDQLEDLPCSIEGTLLQWVIPLGVK